MYNRFPSLLIKIGASTPILPYILDNVSNTNLVGAWSMRQLKSGITYANNIRRNSDNSTVDIGFSSGDYNTNALSSHVSSNSGFVTAWYDQSGNSRTLSQATNANQPRIVNAGTNDVINSKVTNYYNGTSSSLVTSTLISGLVNNNNLSIFLVYQKFTSVYATIVNQGKNAAYFHFGLATGPNPNNTLRWRNSNADYDYGSNTNTLSDKQVISIINIGASSECFRNGISIGTTANGIMANSVVTGNELAIGRRAGDASEFLNANLSEIIIFTRNLSTIERQTIERNMGTYYGITVA
jgi:hypothetical protein